MKIEIYLKNTSETLHLGKALAQNLPQQCVIYLKGELGAGKTTFVRGLLTALGHTGAVKSPTYTLVEPYQLTHHRIYHFDLYRLRDPEELTLIGIRDYIDNSVLLIEWPEKASAYLPHPDIEFELSIHKMGRLIHGTAFSEVGKILLKTLSKKD
ncbi:MAG: tRNA (adenosine(37)-N6)-threonylcarbamoyltransferase complex ATPase subunit type 1 TsaE [Pseudomonadota bacterium]